ncbi:MAG TPA: DUF2784 domain-containing protein [Blastocatellia bacterium]|nr:DUF2784 domain-containing protein [Blastocatellia bacterium]
MSYRILADFVVLLHLAFVLFVLFGGLLVLKWKRCALIHIPAFFWGALIEFTGWICPLTPLENWLRQKGGERGYSDGFIEHYIVALLYPASLSRRLQITFGILVLIVNLGVYGYIVWRGRRANRALKQ